MNTKLLRVATLLLVGPALIALQQRAARRRRMALRAQAKPAAVQTWEGEGGALPVTGPQIGPEPSVVSAGNSGATAPTH